MSFSLLNLSVCDAAAIDSAFFVLHAIACDDTRCFFSDYASREIGSLLDQLCACVPDEREKESEKALQCVVWDLGAKDTNNNKTAQPTVKCESTRVGNWLVGLLMPIEYYATLCPLKPNGSYN